VKSEFRHVCSVLKNVRWYFYTFDINKLEDKDLEAYRLIDLCLDQVLICNQHLTNSLTTLVRAYMGRKVFYTIYPKGIFPFYLRNEGPRLIKKYGDEIIDKFEAISKINIVRNVTADDFYNHLFTKEDLLDLSKPYNDIILLKREIGKNIIPDENLENGYFLGCLLKKAVDEYRIIAEKQSYGPKGDPYIFIEPHKGLLNRALGFKKQTDEKKERLTEKK
jgi:hypothetical protein